MFLNWIFIISALLHSSFIHGFKIPKRNFPTSTSYVNFQHPRPKYYYTTSTKRPSIRFDETLPRATSTSSPFSLTISSKKPEFYYSPKTTAVPQLGFGSTTPSSYHPELIYRTTPNPPLAHNPSLSDPSLFYSPSSHASRYPSSIPPGYLYPQKFINPYNRGRYYDPRRLFTVPPQTKFYDPYLSDNYNTNSISLKNVHTNSNDEDEPSNNDGEEIFFEYEDDYQNHQNFEPKRTHPLLNRRINPRERYQNQYVKPGLFQRAPHLVFPIQDTLPISNQVFSQQAIHTPPRRGGHRASIRNRVKPSPIEKPNTRQDIIPQRPDKNIQDRPQSRRFPTNVPRKVIPSVVIKESSISGSIPKQHTQPEFSTHPSPPYLTKTGIVLKAYPDELLPDSFSSNPRRTSIPAIPREIISKPTVQTNDIEHDVSKLPPGYKIYEAVPRRPNTLTNRSGRKGGKFENFPTNDDDIFKLVAGLSSPEVAFLLGSEELFKSDPLNSEVIKLNKKLNKTKSLRVDKR